MLNRGPGPCPICGAPDSACKPGDAVTEARSGIRLVGTVFDGPPWAGAFPYRSRERVYGVNERGQRVLRYGVGASIPLIEAVRQGVVEAAQLTAEQKAELLAHAERDPEMKEALIMALKARKPKNKMVKEQQVVTKGES